MLKQAFQAGEKTAYDLFKVAWPSGQAIGKAVQSQMGHLGELGRGVRGMFSADPIAHMAGRTQAWQGLKGALPTLGGAAALGLGAYGLSGPSEEQKRQQMMQQMLMARGGY